MVALGTSAGAAMARNSWILAPIFSGACMAAGACFLRGSKVSIGRPDMLTSQYLLELAFGGVPIFVVTSSWLLLGLSPAHFVLQVMYNMAWFGCMFFLCANWGRAGSACGVSLAYLLMNMTYSLAECGAAPPTGTFWCLSAFAVEDSCIFAIPIYSWFANATTIFLFPWAAFTHYVRDQNLILLTSYCVNSSIVFGGTIADTVFLLFFVGDPVELVLLLGGSIYWVFFTAASLSVCSYGCFLYRRRLRRLPPSLARVGYVRLGLARRRLMFLSSFFGGDFGNFPGIYLIYVSFFL